MTAISALGDPALQSMLDALQAESATQETETRRYFAERAKTGDLPRDGLDADANHFLADKMVALEPPKAEFCYLMCRALRARRVVEVGTSFGVSTLYLAAAVRDNGGGVVIGTEYEAAKAAKARANFVAAGLSDYIDLFEGDLRETLKAVKGPVDFVLMDVWTPMARPALELLAPHLRPGAMVVADNTDQVRDDYRAFFEFVQDEKNGLRNMTLPFQGGLEVVVRV